MQTMTHHPSKMNVDYLKTLATLQHRNTINQGMFIPAGEKRYGIQWQDVKKKPDSIDIIRNRLEQKLGILRKKEMHLYINQDYSKRTAHWLEDHRLSVEKKLQEEAKRRTMSAAGNSPDGFSPYAAYRSDRPGLVSIIKLAQLKSELTHTDAMKKENTALLGDIEKAIAHTRVMIEINEQSLNRLDYADITGSR